MQQWTSNRHKAMAWIASAGAAVAVTSLTLTLAPNASGSATYAEPAASPEAQSALNVAESLSTAFENVAEAIGPGVVSIRTTQKVKARQMRAPQIPDEFRRFFGDQLPFNGPNSTPEPRFRQGSGSGFVFSDNGLIVTNNHVVEDASEITVQFTDGRTYQAELIGADPQTDIAVLRVDATDLTVLHLGDSDDLRVGEFVVAAGSPFGLTSTITTGIVSATGRSAVGLNDYENFIQTDAAINPGNSGGPLTNLRGEVIGVNSAILTRSGGSNGIGFAIPINMVKSVTNALVADGYVTRGYLGVVIQDLTPDMAQSFGYRGTAGALVADVQEGMPAAEAGLQSGDIISELNGRRISNASDLRLRVADIQPGEPATIKAMRNGKWTTINATIGAAPGKATEAARPASDALAKSFGAELSTLTPEAAEQLELPTTASGVLVKSVEPMGAAARAGLRPGDVIIAANTTTIASLPELQKALKSEDLKSGVRLTVRSSAGTRFVFLRERG